MTNNNNNNKHVTKNTYKAEGKCLNIVNDEYRLVVAQHIATFSSTMSVSHDAIHRAHHVTGFSGTEAIATCRCAWWHIQFSLACDSGFCAYMPCHFMISPLHNISLFLDEYE